MSVLLLFLSQIAFAQTLSWPVPEGAGDKFELKGYKISYEIMESDECTDLDSDLRYHVDVGNVNSWNLRKDKNFQEGFTYLMRVSSYTETSESVESDISACIKIKKPNTSNPEIEKEVHLDLKNVRPGSQFNNQPSNQQKKEIAKDEKTNSSIFSIAHADELGRERDVQVESGATERGGAEDYDRRVQTLFSGRKQHDGAAGEVFRPATINPTVSGPSNRRGIVYGEPDKQRVARGANIQLSNGVVSSGNGRNKGVFRKIQLSVVDDEDAKPRPANETNSNRLILWIVGALAALGGIIYWLRGDK